jgi:hypothetical protein
VSPPKIRSLTVGVDETGNFGAVQLACACSSSAGLSASSYSTAPGKSAATTSHASGLPIALSILATWVCVTRTNPVTVARTPPCRPGRLTRRLLVPDAKELVPHHGKVAPRGDARILRPLGIRPPHAGQHHRLHINHLNTLLNNQLVGGGQDGSFRLLPVAPV